MPATSSGRIERIKETISEGRGQEGNTDEDRPELEKIIKRLQGDFGPAQKPAGLSQSPVQKQKNAQTEEFQQIDFTKVSFESEPGEEGPGDFLKTIGGIYDAITPLVALLATFVSKLPGAANLKNDLDASDITLTPEAYVVAVTVVAMLCSVFALFLVPVVALISKLPAIAAAAPLIALFLFFLVGIAGLAYPAMSASEKAVKINRELPFALRHLSTQIKAGVSFHRALASVAAGDYGILSIELSKTLRDLEKGSSTEDALLDLAHRTRSVGLKKAIIQIIRALKTGGNLSEIIKDIANDVSFEYQMRVRDFVEKLNIINVIFTMIAVVGPVTVTIISAVAQLPALGAALPFSFVVLIFMADVAAMILIVWFITKMEASL